MANSSRPGSALRHPLSAEQAAAMMQAAKSLDLWGDRASALMVILWRAQSRVAAALRIYPEHIDFRTGAITILRDKWSSGRVVGIDQEGLDVISRWLRRRKRRLGVGRRAPLFCKLKGRPEAICRSQAWKVIRRLGREAGIDRPVFPHLLRHTGAYELMTESVPLTIIQRQLGHSHLATTERYVAHTYPAEVVERIHNRCWQGR